MMRDAKKAALAAVEQKKELLEQVSDSIWECAELSLQEYRSAALFCQVLTQQGFAVEHRVSAVSKRRFPPAMAAADPLSVFWRNTMPCRDCPRRAAARKRHP